MTTTRTRDGDRPREPGAGTALFIIDMISCWDFPDAGQLLPHAAQITANIAALKARCRKAGLPVIYANDNRGRWRSDFARLVQLSTECGGAAKRITEALMPDEDDYFVLKPKHSAFFGTPTELLLEHLEVQRIIVTGVSSDQCVLATAAEARMRDLDVVVPRDCVASQSKARNNAVLKQFEQTLGLRTTPGSRLRLQPALSGHDPEHSSGRKSQRPKNLKNTIKDPPGDRVRAL